MTVEVEPMAGFDGGRRLGGRYDVGEVLGTGGTSEVRSGWDRRLERPVAVKLLRPGLGDDPVVRRRFAEEARAAARLSHPNIVAVFDTGAPSLDDPPFLVMERLAGATLRTALEAGPLPVLEVRRLAEQMLSALQAGARAGVVHCDIKPGNILDAGDGVWKLADFGIASSVGCTDADDTQADMVMGTPAYLAPERLCGQPATECSDLFALGVVLYEALTGVRPYRSMPSFPWSTALSGEPAEPVRALRPDTEPLLAAVVDRSILLDPGHRFPTADDMAGALAGTGFRPAPAAAVRKRRSRRALRRIATATVAGAAALTASLLVVTAGGPAHPAPAGTGSSSTASGTAATTPAPAASPPSSVAVAAVTAPVTVPAAAASVPAKQLPPAHRDGGPVPPAKGPGAAHSSGPGSHRAGPGPAAKPH